MSPRVSIIVPVYNVEKYLHRCIDSVLRQTMEDWELILIDDGSPDQCGAICDEYAAADTRIKVIHQPNAGLSSARNRGLDTARGELLTFLDSDDWWHHDFLTHLSGIVDSKEADIAISRLVRTCLHLKDFPLRPGETVMDKRTALARLLGADHSVLVVACSKLYRSELFQGLRFPVGRVHEDEFTTYQTFLKAETVALCDEALYYYWQRPDSIMGGGYNERVGADSIAAAIEQREAMGRLEDIPLLVAATAQLVRRLVRQYRYLVSQGGDFEQISTSRAAIRRLMWEARHEPLPFALRGFGWLYAHLPALIRPAHTLYLWFRESVRPDGPITRSSSLR